MYSLLYNIYKEKSSEINIFLCFLAFFYVLYSKAAKTSVIFASFNVKNFIFSYISLLFPLLNPRF